MSQLLHRLSLIVLTAVPILLLVAFMVDGWFLRYLAALSAPVVPFALIFLGMGHRASRLRQGLIFVQLVLIAGWGCLLWLSARGIHSADAAEASAVLAIMVGGMALGPMVIVSWVHASTFEDLEADLRRILRARRESESDGESRE